MNRRDAIRSLWVTSLTAFARAQAGHVHALVASAAQAAAPWRPKVLTAHQHATVATLSELIIPATDTPGAKAVLVDRFIDAVLADAAPAARATFLRGIGWLDARSLALVKKNFVSSTPAQQTDLLTKLAAEPSAEAPSLVGFFQAVKSMTITGYYTSEVGLVQELGDDGRLMLPEFTGCTHPEHQK